MQTQGTYGERSVLLDVFRTLAISLVVFSHVSEYLKTPYGAYFGIKNFYFVTIGGIGVTFFIVLSGIAIERRYHGRRMPFGQFISRRLYRVYPAYYLCLFLAIVVYIARNNFQCAACESTSILGSITGMNAFMGRWGGPFIAPSWFIGTIVVMYLLYPTITRMMRRRPHLTVAALLVTSVGCRLLIGEYDLLPVRPLDWFPLCRVFEFGFGVYLAQRLGEGFWLCANGYKRLGGVFEQIADISYPLFMVHWTMLLVIDYFLAIVGTYVTVALYLALSVAVSIVVSRVVRRFM
jgi:peptidoglycan/LPS O-acetylase OafA/YrhL